MDTPVFDVLRDRWPDKAAAWDLGKRPVPQRCSDARVLDPETFVVAGSQPAAFRELVRGWPDRDTAEGTAEAVHQLELERAAQPPVIEVTVTTPPGGIPRADLDKLVQDKIADLVAPVAADGVPASPGPRAGDTAVAPRRRRMLTVTRRARDRLAGLREEKPPPVSADDTPTEVLPAITGGFEVAEVHVP